ncbi:Zinc finger MYM-type protein 1 [Eumeta japonica]|uniref:Zinc finger MYM-type protein 1 n=1 Tax=Eumeta variegata TaxID=151549 RepID=A0A4C1Z3Z0_EUMVA|nr:Zinc finger MYM-type protein 1 [Eumeta japonica]
MATPASLRSQAAGERGTGAWQPRLIASSLRQRNDAINSVFSGLSSDIQNDLIKSIAQVIRDEIKSEINFAKFVSVIADETPDISHREQMSVIFRYLTKTGIEERFHGFWSGRSAGDLLTLLTQRREEAIESEVKALTINLVAAKTCVRV